MTSFVISAATTAAASHLEHVQSFQSLQELWNSDDQKERENLTIGKNQKLPMSKYQWPKSVSLY